MKNPFATRIPIFNHPIAAEHHLRPQSAKRETPDQRFARSEKRLEEKSCGVPCTTRSLRRAKVQGFSRRPLTIRKNQSAGVH